MKFMDTPMTPHLATHPGIILKNELESRLMTQKEFAQNIDMQVTMLNEIIKGKRPITPDIALAIEKAIDIPADFWLNMQMQFELDEARIKVRNIERTQQIEIWNVIKQYVPVAAFTKMGLLTTSLLENIQKIWSIYEVNNLDELIENFAVHKTLVLYKKSEKLKNDEINIFGWSKLAMYLAKEKQAADFTTEHEEQLIAELRAVFATNKDIVKQTEAILACHGIKFLILDKFDQTPIDGYSFWSNNHPAIVLTMRKKQLDNFAFALFHELGHVFRHFNDEICAFLNMDNGTYKHPTIEKEADQYAKNSLIDSALWSEFMKHNRSYRTGFTERNMVALATRTSLHPSIILGRYCFETNNYAIKTNIERTIN